MTLYKFLLSLGYTEAEAEETVLRYENGMPIPAEIKKDLNKWAMIPYGQEPKPKHPGGRPRKEISGKITEEPENGIYYTVNEAAEILGVHKHTIQARLRDGTLKGKKLSGVWKIYKKSLKEGGK